MPTVFEQYAPYRPAITAEEQEMLGMGQRNQEMLLADPNVRHWERGWLDGDGKQVPYPLQQEQMRIALNRASDQLRNWSGRQTMFPEEPDIVERFPGVDPLGKACEVDMAFAERYARLQAVLSSRPPEIQAYVGQRLQDMNNLQTRSGQAWDGMLNDCINIRLTTRAAKVAVTEETSRWLLEDAQAMKEGKASIKRVDGMLNVLEYLSGLTDRAPTPRERELMRNLEVPLTPEVEAHRSDPLVAPQSISVEFENFDHQAQQKFFSDPRNWNKRIQDVPEDIANLEAATRAVSRYSKATVDRAISPLFETVEKSAKEVIRRGELVTEKEIISRGDLITVDGKTVREKMYEDYVAAGKDPDGFPRFYQDNVKDATNSYVSAALMAGKRVEAFVPDSRGRIPDEPTQITKAGYEPSPLKKVTLNAWQRHFAKYGYYKEKVARADEYRRVMEARERVKCTNLSAQLGMDSGSSLHVKNQFFGDWIRENGPLPNGVPNSFSVTRSALTTLAVCRLAAQGYGIEAIHDPSQLQAEKQAAGKEVMEHLLAGDAAWAGETLFRGQIKLVENIDRLTTNMNFADNRQILTSANRPLFFAASTAFDAFQEEGHCRPEFAAAAERLYPGHGKEISERLIDQVNSTAMFFNVARTSNLGISELSSGLVSAKGAGMHVHNMMNYEAAKQLFAQKRAADPTRPMSQCYTMPESSGFYSFTAAVRSKDKETMIEMAERGGAAQRALGREALSGRLQARFRIKTNPTLQGIDFKLAPPTKQAVKEESNAKRIEEAAQKNTAKGPVKMGGGRAR